MQIGSKQLGHKMAMSTDKSIFDGTSDLPTYISSSGEMKMSLKLITCAYSVTLVLVGFHFLSTHVLMLKVFQQLQFSVGPLG